MDLSPEEVQRLAMLADMGHATPDDVRRLLHHLCAKLEDGYPIHPWAARFLAKGFRGFLEGRQSLQAAFGLVRKRRGRKSAVESNRDKIGNIAAEVLEHRLNGESLEVAAVAVGQKYHLGETQVRDYWRRRKEDALLYLRHSRKDRDPPWSDNDLKRIAKIFQKHIKTGDDQRDWREGRWLILNLDAAPATPGNSRKKPA